MEQKIDQDSSTSEYVTNINNEDNPDDSSQVGTLNKTQIDLDLDPNSRPVKVSSLSSAAIISGSSNGKLKSMSLNPFDFIFGKKRKAPTSKEVATELVKLEKLTLKAVTQQKKVLDSIRDWGSEQPEPETRELISNMHNLMSGPVIIYKELQSRLATIHSHFSELAKMEEQNMKVENELKATQKLYYKANYRDFPPYQIDSYQASYENYCAEIDELRLRHRNRLVFMIKQSYQLVLQQMLDCHQTQKVCAETGIRFLSVFDAEPKEVLPEGYTTYSSAYTAMYHNGLGVHIGPGTGSPQVLSSQNHGGHEGDLFNDKDERDALKVKKSINESGKSTKPQMSLSALSLSPAAQKVTNQTLGYQYYSVDGNKENISDDHSLGPQNGSKSGVDENHHLRNNSGYNHEIRKGIPSDATNPEAAKLLQSANRVQYGEEDDDEEKVRPYNVPLQNYPTVASPFAGFRSMNGFSRFS